MIILYTMLSSSPNIRKITMMLNEAGLPYKVHKFERQEDGKLPEDFLAINPNGTVPAILDEDTGAVLFESAAILYYLAEKSGKLLPAELKDKGEAMKWLVFEAANMGATMGELYHYMLRAADELADVHLQRYKDKVAQFCSILEMQLQGREYLCGEYTIADIALYPWTVVLEDMADVNLGDYPGLNSWATRVSQRPAAMASV
jgi:GSH-dependent disulfide-bond oxidoreductase